MSSGWGFYATTILTLLAINAIACWSFNLQLGTTGVLNFAFIVFQAVGAYTVAVFTVGSPASLGGYEHYVLGFHLPFLVALLAAGIVGGVLAIPVGLVGLRRLRSDYQAIVMLVVSMVATDIAESDIGLVNGSAGISSIPQPFEGSLQLSQGSYKWFFLALAAVVAVVLYLALRRLLRAPLGRSLRAVRENEFAAEALGRNVTAIRLTSMVVGGIVAAISGGLLAAYIGAWAPGSWLFTETFVYLAAIIVGGRGNNIGVLIGALLEPGFLELSQFLPSIGNPQAFAAVQWIVAAALLLVFLWFWPRGILPERPITEQRLRRYAGLGRGRR